MHTCEGKHLIQFTVILVKGFDLQCEMGTCKQEKSLTSIQLHTAFF